MKKVLIALDYDQSAHKVARAGYKLAETMKAEVVLLHVTADPLYYASVEPYLMPGFEDSYTMEPLIFETMEALKQSSQEFLDKTKRFLGDETIGTLVKEGDLADSILLAAKEMHADVIVLGSHSRRWLENIVMGSVTEKVLHHTSIPLFIVPIKKHD